MSVSGVKTVPCISAAHWWPPNTSGTLRLPGRHGPTWTGRVALRLCSPERRDPWMRAAWAGSLPKSQAAAEAKLSIALGLAFFFPLLFFLVVREGVIIIIFRSIVFSLLACLCFLRASRRVVSIGSPVVSAIRAARKESDRTGGRRDLLLSGCQVPRPLQITCPHPAVLSSQGPPRVRPIILRRCGTKAKRQQNGCRRPRPSHARILA